MIQTMPPTIRRLLARTIIMRPNQRARVGATFQNAKRKRAPTAPCARLRFAFRQRRGIARSRSERFWLFVPLPRPTLKSPSDTEVRRYSTQRAATGLVASLLLALLAFPGCAAPGEPVGDTFAMLQIPDLDAYIDNAATYLRQSDFPPERIDRAAATIVSEPVTSGQWFEFWRIDSQGPYQTLESSLHTTRRRVTIELVRQGDGAASEPAIRDPRSEPETSAPASPPPAGRYRVAVRVEKERYNAPQRQITTASGALGIYNDRVPTREGLRGARSRGEQWVPQGRDGLLEAFLLEKLADLRADVQPVE
ncbi:hypothetical protein RAS1_39560 [Phycisphaerae bacterium RAS1]|nr:hypothetical protein RAS1_39560 [Phycisphaerae bacterium RAS1]